MKIYFGQKPPLALGGSVTDPADRTAHRRWFQLAIVVVQCDGRRSTPRFSGGALLESAGKCSTQSPHILGRSFGITRAVGASQHWQMRSLRSWPRLAPATFLFGRHQVPTYAAIERSSPQVHCPDHPDSARLGASLNPELGV